jgi:hypothetical protein
MLLRSHIIVRTVGMPISAWSQVLCVVFLTIFSGRLIAQNTFFSEKVSNERESINDENAIASSEALAAHLLGQGYSTRYYWGHRNYAVRFGVLAGANLNFHTPQFRNLPLLSWNSSSGAAGIFNDASVGGNISLGYVVGANCEIPIGEQFAVGARLVAASHSALVNVSLGHTLDVKLTTLSTDLFGVWTVTEYVRVYGGFSLAFLNNKMFSSRHTNISSSQELPQSSLALFSPFIGIGYDFLFPEESDEATWIITPELIGLTALNHVIWGLPLDEYWYLSQIRLGVAVSYQMANN